MNAKERAEAIRQYRHLRSAAVSHRLNARERQDVRDRANALAARYHLTTARL